MLSIHYLLMEFIFPFQQTLCIPQQNMVMNEFGPSPPYMKHTCTNCWQNEIRSSSYTETQGTKHTSSNYT
jgi:hypothetical protein